MNMRTYLSQAEILARLGISRATLYRWISEGRFPRPLILGPRVRRWRAGVIENWLKSLERAAGYADQIPETGA